MDNSLFKALDDPTRRQILEMLSREGSLSAGEISSRFDISAPSVSHHLSILKNAGLIADERQRQSIVYSLCPAPMQNALAWMQALLRDHEGQQKG